MALIKLTIALSLLLFTSCSDEKKGTEQSVPKTAKSQAEDFNTFFEKFSSDSIFQKSRIQFPLTTVTYDVDSDKDDTSTIKANEWNFFNIKEIIQDKKLLYKTRKEKDKYILNATVEDTGIYVDYIFEQRKGKWMMVRIADQST